MLPTQTELPGVTLVLDGGPILAPSSNPALRGVNLEVVGGPPQAVKRLRQYWSYGNRPVIANRAGQWTFWNWGNIGLSPAWQEPTEINKTPKHYTMMGGHNISSSLKKKRKHTQWVSASKSNKRHLTSLDLKAKVVRLGDGWHVSGRSIASLDCSSKWSNSRSVLPTDSHTSQPPSLTSGGNDELVPNTSNLRVDHHVWGDWTFYSPLKVLVSTWTSYPLILQATLYYYNVNMYMHHKSHENAEITLFCIGYVTIKL